MKLTHTQRKGLEFNNIKHMLGITVSSRITLTRGDFPKVILQYLLQIMAGHRDFDISTAIPNIHSMTFAKQKMTKISN